MCAKVNALCVKVMKPADFMKEGVDCTNNGISSVYDNLYLVCPSGPREVDEDDPRLIKAVRRQFGSRVVWHAEPYHGVPEGHVGWMAGGNFVHSCDSRFSEMFGDFYGAVSLHDRKEQYKEYEMYSR